jgi:hypothetical protein
VAIGCRKQKEMQHTGSRKLKVLVATLAVGRRKKLANV